MKKSNIWFLLSVLGAVVPYYFFAHQFAATGLDLMAFINPLFASGASAGFTADLLITSFIFWIWIVGEPDRLTTKNISILIVINLTIGLSCALPLYFWMKTNKTTTGWEK